MQLENAVNAKSKHSNAKSENRTKIVTPNSQKCQNSVTKGVSEMKTKSLPKVAKPDTKIEEKQAGNRNANANVDETNAVSSNEENHKILVSVACTVVGLVKNKSVEVLVDSGASMSVMSKQLYEMIPEMKNCEWRKGKIAKASAANGSEVQFAGECKVPIEMGSRTMEHWVYIAENLSYDIILGCDFLEKYKAKIDFDAKLLILPEAKEIHIFKRLDLGDRYVARTKQHTVIEPNSVKLVCAELTGKEKDVPNNMQGIVEGFCENTNVLVGKRPKGGYECELDVVAFHPEKKHLVHVEASMDASSWSEREKRFKRKFEAGKKHIPDLFKDLDTPKQIDQIAVLVFASKQNRATLAGGRLILGNELLEEIFGDLKHRSIYSRTIPEQFPIVRALQFVAQYRNEVCSILLANET